jgi:hypothetical protein
MKKHFDFTDILANVEKAKEAQERIRIELQMGDMKELMFVNADTVDYTKFGFITSKLVQTLVDRKIMYKEFADWVIKNCTWIKATENQSEIEKRKQFAYNFKSAIRNHQNLTEDRVEMLADFLDVDIVVLERANRREIR